jgi:hypothetical protein
MNTPWPPINWCPLFGLLPMIDATPNTFSGRCIEVITQARFLLNISPEDYSPGGTDWPESGKVRFIEESILLSTRAIYRRYGDIFSYAQQYGSTWVPTDEDGVSLDHAHGPDQIPECVLSFARQSIGFNQTTPDYVVFAVLAIAQAKNALEDCIEYGDKQVEPLASGQVFLSEAKNLILEEEFQTEMEILKPLVETGRKVREGMEQGRKIGSITRSQRAREEKEQIRAIATVKWKEKPGWTVGQMAKHVHNFLLAKELFAPAIGTIRNALKGLKQEVFPSDD